MCLCDVLFSLEFTVSTPSHSIPTTARHVVVAPAYVERPGDPITRLEAEIYEIKNKFSNSKVGLNGCGNKVVLTNVIWRRRKDTIDNYCMIIQWDRVSLF